MNKVILIGIIVCIVVAIAIGIFFGVKDLTKKSDGDGDAKRPELNFSSEATKTIKPQEGEEKKVEAYTIEYAEGEADEKESSKYIDLTLKWTNQEGFNGVVDKLIFTRTIEGVDIQPKQEVTEESAITDYGNGSVTFKGTDVTASSVKGPNTIKAYYNEMKQENLLATAEIGISASDFNTTLAGPFGDLKVDVTISSESFKLTKQVKKTYYQVSHAPGRWFNVAPQGGGKYKFRSDSGLFLKLPKDSGIDTFEMKNYKGKKVLVNNGKMWVHNRSAWVPMNKLTKDDYRFAQCDVIAANQLARSDANGGNIFHADEKVFYSPNEKFTFKLDKANGNMYVKTKEGEKHVIATGPNKASAKLVMQTDANLAMYDAANKFTWAAETYKHRVILGSKGPYAFILSDGGGLHVIDENGQELNTHRGTLGWSSGYYKTHLGDIWGFDVSSRYNINLDSCINKCDTNIDCAGVSHSRKGDYDANHHCFLKSYATRIEGIAPNHPDQNANRWGDDGGENPFQFYQKKVDEKCYRDRYTDLKQHFGNDPTKLYNHYWDYGTEEGRDPTCDTKRPHNSKLGYSKGGEAYYEDAATKVGSSGQCMQIAKDKGYPIWGYRTSAQDNYWANTCYLYKDGKAGSQAGEWLSRVNHFTGCVDGGTLESGCAGAPCKYPELHKQNDGKGVLGWQGSGPDQGGLVWKKEGKGPWNKYYRISCKTDKCESGKTAPFGPVVNHNWHYPKIRMAANGVNPCGDGEVRVWRSNRQLGGYKDITDEDRLKNFPGTGKYDKKDAIFWDQVPH